jgi:hypothetical protein
MIDTWAAFIRSSCLELTKSRVLFSCVGAWPSESQFCPPCGPSLHGETPRSVAFSSMGGSPVPQLDVELSSSRS